jgi:ABC-type transporter Mla subunit MlaD
MSAEIIPFPAAKPAEESGANGEARLRRALVALDEAVANQRAAVAEWRRSLAQLGDTMGGLRGSLTHYRGSLNRLEQQVGALHGQAVTLEQWADKAVASGGESGA